MNLLRTFNIRSKRFPFLVTAVVDADFAKYGNLTNMIHVSWSNRGQHRWSLMTLVLYSSQTSTTSESLNNQSKILTIAIVY